jgi:hypothetical protein
MCTFQTTKEDFPKNTGKKYKVIINAGGRFIWIYNYKFYELS